MTTTAQKPGNGVSRRISRVGRWLPAYFWQRITRREATGHTHLIFTLADHFEPSITPDGTAARVPYAEQEQRLERWCREYPLQFREFRDAEERPFVHTYFYPAEQYDRAHIARLAEHCHAGWGEIEVHLHHGAGAVPDSAENTRRQLIEFRDTLARDHSCLSYSGGQTVPRYAFVHGNFALANSNEGRGCGVDNEIEILAETGCYADLTLPAAPFHPAQTAKINAIYECGLPLGERAPHGKGRNLARGRAPQIFPIIVQGPLMLDFKTREARRFGIDNGALIRAIPASMHRLDLWKRAVIGVQGRPDWLFIKLHCHGMDPRDDQALLGAPMRQFLRDLVTSAKERCETLHFVSAREMVNIILAACDGREGNPGDYRDYQLKRERPHATEAAVQRALVERTSEAVLKG